jgi:hypothetical protein
MTIGDLFDLLEEKLKTGEFGRDDSIEVVGCQQGFFEMYPIQDVVKGAAYTVKIEIEGYIGGMPDMSGESNEQDELEEEIEELKEDIRDLKEAIEEAVEYLDGDKLNTIGSGSELHRDFKSVLANCK